jgi:hypothetical protein
MEVSAFGGAVEYPRSLGNTNATYGGSFGLGVYSRVVLFGEVSNTTPRDLLDYNGGLKVSLSQNGRFEPYVLGGIGGGHFGNEGLFGSSNRFQANAGIGARLYVRNWWGVQPEFRWMHYFRESSDFDTIRFTGGLFFQFGR